MKSTRILGPKIQWTKFRKTTIMFKFGKYMLIFAPHAAHLLKSTLVPEYNICESVIPNGRPKLLSNYSLSFFILLITLGLNKS